MTVLLEKPTETIAPPTTPRIVKIARTPEQIAAESIFPFPAESELEGEFTESAALNDLADYLIEKHTLYAGECKIVLRLRDKGGRKQGKPVYYKITKASGWNKHLANGADFLAWIAVDHLAEMGATRRQVEACVFEMLVQIGESTPPDPENIPADWVAEPCIPPPDAVIYNDALLAFGVWRNDMRQSVGVIRQLKLIDGE